MGDDALVPAKRSKFREDIQETVIEDPATKRKQVDAHVQAFLKTVLDHAKKKSLLTSSKTSSKDVRDASTQTEELMDSNANCQWDKDIISSFTNSEATYFSTNHLYPTSESSTTFVPNLAMYSQETLQLASLQDDYYNRIQGELETIHSFPQCYFTDASLGASRESESSNSANISSTEVRRVIAEWVEKYELWFYQNFGVDIKSVAASQNGTPFIPNTQASSNFNQFYSPQIVPANSTTADNHSVAVVSGAPVSYIISEGSMCMPENQKFSPYVSLLPSYTPAAFSHYLPQQELTINPVQFYTSVPANFVSNQVTPIVLSQQVLAQPQPPTQPCSQFSPSVPVCSSVISGSMSAGVGDGIQTTAAPATTFSDLPADLQTSAMLAALSFPLNNSRQPSMGQWGPLLRYGTYGRLPSPNEIQQLKPNSNNLTAPAAISEGCVSVASSGSFGSTDSAPNKMPPPPPTFILLRRQAMICALQLSCRERGRELFLREKESTSGLKVDFVSELEQIVEKSIGLKPVYLFVQLNNLPESERSYFLEDKQEPEVRAHTYQVQQTEPLDASRMYACDLLIGDVLIAEACSTYKQQAQHCVARQAFKILSQPCFLVGSVRRWEMVDYLVLCLSSKADLVPKLPPFLSDPFESLSKKDRSIDPSKPNESFDVVNPKPHEDFWLYLADLPMAAFENEAYYERILTQSAEFSQMTVAFDVEVNMESGLFLCSAIIDKHRYQFVTGSTVSEAEKKAIRGLIKTLELTQPIVGAVSPKPGSRWKSERLEPLWGVSERSLIDTLMWGKEERDLAIDIEQLEAHCDVPELPEPTPPEENNRNPGGSNEDDQAESDRFASPRHLENYVQAYAASALVTPLRLSSRTVPPRVWPLVRQIARNWGLLSCIEKQCLIDNIILCVLICKRAPLPRLKRTLYERGNYGCFTLLGKGNLNAEAQKRLLAVEPLVYEDVTEASFPNCLHSPSSTFHNPSLSVDEIDPYSEEPVTRLARHFISTGPKLAPIKSEPGAPKEEQPFEDCVLLTAELNQPSNAIEILDDLPKTLIPGIDF